jgi:hypothetical protein
MADGAIRAIPVRNPRTGQTDFTLTPAPAEEIAQKAAQ